MLILSCAAVSSCVQLVLHDCFHSLLTMHMRLAYHFHFLQRAQQQTPAGRAVLSGGPVDRQGARSHTACGRGFVSVGPNTLKN